MAKAKRNITALMRDNRTCAPLSKLAVTNCCQVKGCTEMAAVSFSKPATEGAPLTVVRKCATHYFNLQTKQLTRKQQEKQDLLKFLGFI